MFKSFQDTSSQSQFKSFPNLNMQQATSAYGFSGVTFWLDAAYGLNTQTNLGAVSSWQARVGGATFVQATAGNQPRLILNDVNYNNLPSVEAQDLGRFMLSSTSNGLKYQENITIAVISKVNTANVYNGIIGTNTGNSVGVFDGGTSTSPALNGFGMINSTVNIQGTTESTNARIKIVTRTNVIVNGVNETTGTSLINNLEFIRLFANGTNAGFNLIGTIAEIIAFGYSMTSDEAIALSNNINQKYAIY